MIEKKYEGNFLVYGSVEDWIEEEKKLQKIYESSDKISQTSPAMILVLMRLSKIRGLIDKCKNKHPRINN